MDVITLVTAGPPGSLNYLMKIADKPDVEPHETSRRAKASTVMLRNYIRIKRYTTPAGTRVRVSMTYLGMPDVFEQYATTVQNALQVYDDIQARRIRVTWHQIENGVLCLL